VDLGYVKEAAKLAKEAGVPHFSLLTAQGANPRAWASNFILLHGLLYLNTKGQAEEFVKAQVKVFLAVTWQPPPNIPALLRSLRAAVHRQV